MRKKHRHSARRGSTGVRTRTGCFAGIFAAAAAAPSSAEPLDVVYIGNSFMWDAQPQLHAAQSEANGQDLNAQWHIACSRTAAFIADNPSSAICVNSSTPWQDAVSAETDVVVLQAHDALDGSVADEAAGILALADYALALNPDVRLLVYATWSVYGSDLGTLWQQPLASDRSRPFPRTAEAFDFIFDDLRRRRPEADVSLVSVGDLLVQLEDRIEDAVAAESDYFGLTRSRDIFRDFIPHLSNSVGRRLANAAVWGEVSGLDPALLITPETSDLNRALYELASSGSSNRVIPEPGAGAAITLLMLPLLRRRSSSAAGC